MKQVRCAKCAHPMTTPPYHCTCWLTLAYTGIDGLSTYCGESWTHCTFGPAAEPLFSTFKLSAEAGDHVHEPHKKLLENCVGALGETSRAVPPGLTSCGLSAFAARMELT